MAFYTMNDGEAVYVREIGTGTPVLVLSGLGMKSWQWLGFIAPLQKQFKFIIPDWRGFGGSANCKIPAHLNAIQSHCSDVIAILDQLKIQKCIVVAYSMGATTAMHAMKYAQFASRIQAYLHIDQSPKITVDSTWQYGLFSEKHAQFKTYLKQLSQLFYNANHPLHLNELSSSERYHLFNTWQQLCAFQGTNTLVPKLFNLGKKHSFLQPRILPIQRLDYFAWYINTYLNEHEDYRTTLLQLNCPVHFFIGAQSSLYSAIGQRIIAQSLAQSQTVEFQKSGHAPLLSEPLKFRAELHRFLNNQLK